MRRLRAATRTESTGAWFWFPVTARHDSLPAAWTAAVAAVSELRQSRVQVAALPVGLPDAAHSRTGPLRHGSTVCAACCKHCVDRGARLASVRCGSFASGVGAKGAARLRGAGGYGIFAPDDV